MIKATPWGVLPDGRAVQLFRMTNDIGMEVVLSDLGASLISWSVKDDATQAAANIVLGHDTPHEYLRATAFMGGTIGRWANRIEAGRFVLRGVEYQVDVNDGTNHLHGGKTGFHRMVWDALPFENGVTFTLRSPDGEAGFPASVDVRVTYTLDASGCLAIHYEAQSDAPTLLNLTNHSYFNLAGDDGDIRDHYIAIDADEFLAVDDRLIPVRQMKVAGTPFDLRDGGCIGERLDGSHDQLNVTGGFDHCFVLESPSGALPVRRVAVLRHPPSKRELTVSTDAPGLQFYTGNFLEGVVGRDGRVYQKHDGLCLEPGEFPNAPNLKGARNGIVEPGRVYRRVIEFAVRAD